MLTQTKKVVSILHANDLLTFLIDNLTTAISSALGSISDFNTQFSKVYCAINNGRELKSTHLFGSIEGSRAVQWEICKTLQAGLSWKGVPHRKGLRDKTYCWETSIAPIGNILLYNENSNGTGLGLYSMKRIVEVFKEKISLVSQLNQGASFKVFLQNL